MKVRNIVISAFIGSGNIGDEAILSSIISQVKKGSSFVKLTVFSLNPHYTASKFGVKAVSTRSIHKVIWEILKADLLICGGGGLLQDETSVFSLPSILWKPYLAFWLNKRVMFYAVGAGPMGTKFGRILVRIVVGHSSIVTVRDGDSKEVLTKIGIKRDKVEVTADPSVDLAPCSSERANHIMHMERIPTERLIVAVCLRYWFYHGKRISTGIVEKRAFSKGRHSDKYYSFIEETARALDTIIERYDVNLLFIPFYYGRDDKIHDDIIRNLENDERAHCIEGKYGPSEILGIMKNLQFVIGMRLHSLIFGALAELPMVAIKYSQKVGSFMNMIHLQNFQLDLDDLTSEKIFHAFTYAWEEHDEIKHRIRKSLIPIRRIEKLNCEILFKLVD